MSHHEKTEIAARGKWKGILMALGLPSRALTGKHGPCPICGGDDRFRWDNLEGRGTFICTHHGAGSGMALAMQWLKCDFREAAQKIDRILGNEKIEADRPKPQMSDDDRLRMLRRTWAETRPMMPGDLADRYLASRGLNMGAYPKCLRFAERLADGEGGVRPCMVAAVGVHGEKTYSTMHRTFLRPDGKAKAEMGRPRKMMPGEIPPGACVQLSDWSGGPLGIAEGIETALAAASVFHMPVWAVLSSSMMEKWRPPENCAEVVIYGDNDEKFGGQKAAYSLAHKLAVERLSVSVILPQNPGEDWNDYLNAHQPLRTMAQNATIPMQGVI